MNKEKTAARSPNHSHHDHGQKKDRTILKGIGSVLLAVVASSHHWLHTLLIALGLTSLGAGFLQVSPPAKMVFLFISLIVSLWFLAVAKRRWKVDRPSAWVYLISSIISIVLVATAIPQTVNDIIKQQEQKQQQEHIQHH